MSFLLFFHDKVLASDVKGENLYAQPSTLETVAMNFENKKWCFGQKSEKTQNSLFVNRTFDRKKARQNQTKALYFCKRTVMDIHEKSMNLKICK